MDREFKEIPLDEELSSIIGPMSNIDFFNSPDVPQPREKIKIESLEVRPYPDGWRIKLIIRVTPFQERPSLEIAVETVQGRRAAELSVIETMHRHMEFTIHIRGVASPAGQYLVKADLYYDDRAKAQDHHEIPFTIEGS